MEDELLAGEDYQKTIADLTAQLTEANTKIATLQSDYDHLQKTSELDIQAARLKAQERIAKFDMK